MKILVTGGAGFIGSHIVEHYQDKAEEIRVLDNLRTGYLRNLEGLRHTFIEGSICDRELVRQAVQGVDYIFHMAALVSVPESMSKISECIDINVNGLLNVLEEASAAGVKKIVLASSAAIYGDNPTVPKLEAMYPEPKSPYAITKLDGDTTSTCSGRKEKSIRQPCASSMSSAPGRTPRAPMLRPCPFSLKKLSKEKTSPCMGTAPRRAISFM